MPRPLFKSCVAVAAAFLMAASPARADEETAARIHRQIDPLVTYFPPDGSKLPTDALVESLTSGKTARNQLFRLESLLRLYGRAFPDLERYRRQVKELEDGLGDYAFAVDSVIFAREKFVRENEMRAPETGRRQEQEKILGGLERKRDAARRVLTRLVEKTAMAAELPRLRAVVDSRFVDWTRPQNLAYLKTELHRLLKDVRDGRFDFNQLEDGIHEFRRRLRWFPVLVDSLDGAVVLADDPPLSCPVPALTTLAASEAAKHRYSNPALRFPATGACRISRCLLWQVVKTTNDIGSLKDEVQGNGAIAAALDDDIDISVGNAVSPEDSARARAMRMEILSSGALDALMAQISSCP